MTGKKIKSEDFANLVAERLIESGKFKAEQIVFERSLLELNINHSNKAISKISLGNYYQEYCEGNDDRKEQVILRILHGVTASATGRIDDFASLRSRIYPHIVSRWSVEKVNFNFRYLMDGQFKSSSDKLIPHMILAEHFAIVLVEDMPESRRIMALQEFDQAGIKFEEAYQIACKNLRQRSKFEFETFKLDGKALFYESMWRDGYDTSRLLFLPELAGLEIDGDMVVAMPTNDHLILTGSKNLLGITFLTSRIKEWKEAARYLPPILVALAVGGFQK